MARHTPTYVTPTPSGAGKILYSGNGFPNKFQENFESCQQCNCQFTRCHPPLASSNAAIWKILKVLGTPFTHASPMSGKIPGKNLKVASKVAANPHMMSNAGGHPIAFPTTLTGKILEKIQQRPQVSRIMLPFPRWGAPFASVVPSLEKSWKKFQDFPASALMSCIIPCACYFAPGCVSACLVISCPHVR